MFTLDLIGNGRTFCGLVSGYMCILQELLGYGIMYLDKCFEELGV